ncbi:hypothetical protein II5_05863 [Bacillus cereus MSX-A1]|uniref:hypothetical protein n=1 Tax=Bacillus cereus TaxID=1396 RepID=UPI000279749E|nr:hypothetical protein [Bacillus cereus]EJQ98133.1 hypothetical protein II5_05863 [Bacillus cereus MSX-A1]
MVNRNMNNGSKYGADMNNIIYEKISCENNECVTATKDSLNPDPFENSLLSNQWNMLPEESKMFASYGSIYGDLYTWKQTNLPIQFNDGCHGNYRENPLFNWLADLYDDRDPHRFIFFQIDDGRFVIVNRMDGWKTYRMVYCR